MPLLESILYAVSSAFLLPTLVAVLGCFLYTTILTGRTVAELLDRRDNAPRLKALFGAGAGRERFVAESWRGNLAGFHGLVLRHGPVSPLLDKAVTDLENRLRSRLDRISIISRVGPLLGLIGTLIPLQPALAGLAKGDMQAMGANLLLGFTTTVVGLVSGGTAFAIGVAAKNWYLQDLTDIHFLMEHWSNDELRTGKDDLFPAAGPLEAGAPAAGWKHGR